MSDSTPKSWRDLIPVLNDRDANLIGRYEIAGSAPAELLAIAIAAAEEYRFQLDCDELFAQSGAVMPACTDISDWWGPGESHEVTYRNLTVEAVEVTRYVAVEVVTEVEITGAISPLRVEIEADGYRATLAPSEARTAAAALVTAADRVENVA